MSSRRKQWLANAKILNRMSDEERNLAFQLMAQAGRQAGKQLPEIQNEQFELSYWYGAAPAAPGGYDPRAQPELSRQRRRAARIRISAIKRCTGARPPSNSVFSS